MAAKAPLRLLTAAAAAAAATLVAGTARAGPPYLSDDAEPTDPGRWEIYNFVIGARGPDGLGGEAGLDLNYGGYKDLQLTAVVPVAFSNAAGYSLDGLRTGAGAIELAAKYRFLHQADGSWLPDVSLFPRLFTPAGGRRFGNDHVSLLLPVWAEKDFGPWSVFGGGGYQINPGSGQRNFWQGGVAVARDVSPRLQLGAEVYVQGDDTTTGGGFEAVDLGATYKLVKHWSLLASVGPTWNAGGTHGQVFYFALKADY